MKVVVDCMPQTPDDCLFCDVGYSHNMCGLVPYQGRECSLTAQGTCDMLVEAGSVGEVT